MSTPISQAGVYTDFDGLAALRARASKDEEGTLREVAGQFEALFLQMMLKSMRDASLGDGFADGEHTKTYQSMFDKQISIEMSQGGGMGLAEMMIRQLGKSEDLNASEKLNDSKDAKTGSIPFNLDASRLPQALNQVRPDRSITVAEQVSAAEQVKNEWKAESPEAFVRELWPYAQRAAQSLNTKPETLIAQAALETGWGKHMIQGTDGRNSLNLFGIKADQRWSGDRVITETVEFRDGLMRKERAQFRAYDSVAESFKDYTAFIKDNPRYGEALNAKDNQGYTRALSEAGYATDPDYSEKINQIINSDRLRNAIPTNADKSANPLINVFGQTGS